MVPLGSTFYFPPMLNYFNFGRIWLTGGAVIGGEHVEGSGRTFAEQLGSVRQKQGSVDH